jgi:hypothetical protein
MPEPYIVTKFKLEAEIDGVFFKDVVSISATFGLNSIPTAAMVVACGKEVRTGEPATIHSALKTFKPRSPAKVWVTITSSDGFRSDPIIKGMEDGRYLIFEGYYAGVGYQRAHDGVSYTIHLVHWLDDLNCSSMLNGNWMPGAPHDLASAASIHVAALAGGGGSGGSYTNMVPLIEKDSGNLLKPDNLSKDMWAEVIKKIYENIAKFPHPNVCEGGDSSPDSPGNNAAALKALPKIPGKSPKPGKLPLLIAGLDDSLVLTSLNHGLSRMLMEGIGYTSFWSNLIGELGASFLFAISPSVEFANVIPFFSGLNTEWREIDGKEYNYASFNANTGTIIESVNIYYRLQSTSNYANGGKEAQLLGYCRPWGKYPATPDMRGNILVRDPPPWITNVSPQGLWAPGTSLPPLGDTHNPQQAPDHAHGGPKSGSDAEKKVKSSNVMNLFAEHWYKTAVLAQRYGELSGKLRFDIAPGSILKIKAPSSAIGESENEDFFGAVTQVSYVINAEQHIAGTSFGIHSLRTQTENSNTRLTAASPPLYSEAWNGVELALKG